jgi:hypothetical protein
MLELFQAAISAPNLFYTALLALVVLYWGLYVLGAFGEGALDFLGLDLDADVDLDTDLDADLDVDADVGVEAGGVGFLNAFLHFFHVGEIPVAIIFSVLVLAMWFLSLAANHLLDNTSLLIALALFVPIVFVGLVITKAVLTPFAPMLKKVLDTSGDKVKVVGRRCVVVSTQANSEYGQAEIDAEGSSLLLNVRTRDGVTLHKGDEAVVFEHDEPAGVYLIAALDVNENPPEEK